MTVFEEKCLASEPFVKEHVDVNVHLPQMFTELLLNKLFVPYLFPVMVNVLSLDYFFYIWGPETKTSRPVIRPPKQQLYDHIVCLRVLSFLSPLKPKAQEQYCKEWMSYMSYITLLPIVSAPHYYVGLQVRFKNSPIQNWEI